MATLTAKCIGFTRLQSTLDSSLGIKNYYAIIDADHFFNLDGWLKTNVRDPRDRGAIPTQIWDSLNSKDLFPLMNRGIILSIKEVRYESQNQQIEIDLVDPSIHGLIDGGHTYLQVNKFKSERDERRVDKQYVRIELIQGLDKDKTVDIAEGRNKSNQVKEVGLNELRQVFEDIKEAIAGQPYANDVAYKEFETYEDSDEEKPISVIEILRCIVCLDKVNFNEDKHPNNVVTRGGDKEVIRHYRENREKLKPLLGLLPDELVLWDTILEKFVDVYKRVGGVAGRIGDNDDKIFKPLGKKAHFLSFKKGARRPYAFIDSLAYPIFAAFRAAIKPANAKGTRYEWKEGINPSEFFSEIAGPKLTKVICDSLKETKEVSKTVRAESVWVSCYDKVLISLGEFRG